MSAAFRLLLVLGAIALVVPIGALGHGRDEPARARFQEQMPSIRIGAGTARAPWPPRGGRGDLYVHLGEEHYNDEDSQYTLPKTVDEAIRYRPDLVVMSGDKDNDGTVEQLGAWRDIMAAFDAAKIPYFAGVGNHDRKAPPGLPGGTPGVAIDNYLEVFAPRPYPFGDGAPYGGGIQPATRPADDPPGASTHYYVDHGKARFVFLDNSCYSLTLCEARGTTLPNRQNPPFPDAEGITTQVDYLRARGVEAKRDGRLLFAVMHMPTRDVRDVRNVESIINFPHVMQAFLPDNGAFETAAREAGVDAVLVAHIKGMFDYTVGRVPYYVDGGTGGELHTNGPVGIDHGYWHGFRLLRVDGERITTDAVPIFVPGGITVSGPDAVARGAVGEFTATGAQPTLEGEHKVEALELREPRAGDLTPVSSLPMPAFIWTTLNRYVLAPVAAEHDDPRRDERSQTRSGRFRAVCPGRARVEITSGWEASRRAVVVPSRPGRIVRSISASGRRARIRLAQPAEVLVRVRRAGRTVRLLRHACVRGAARVAWDGRVRRGGRLRRAAAGLYRLEVEVRSDRPTVRRAARVRIR